MYAALMKGHDTVEALYFDGSAEAAFVVAVALNVRHGLSLSLPERRAAAARIIRSHPEWSDRSVAQSTGLSATTVAAIRRSIANSEQLNTRLGRDGRMRPLSASKGRQAAAEYLLAHPDSSLRTVAKIAGVSPGTVRDVRARLARGDNPVPTTRTSGGRRTECDCRDTLPASAPERCVNHAALPLLDMLAKDPSIRMTEAGRSLLRWLHSRALDDADPCDIARNIPEDSRPALAEFADRCARNWSEIAKALRSSRSAGDE
ncbi:hypothetical protein MSAR_21010 [Mycolicibacterium sarraceniae]|uniref:Uncharacterized protein n=1 Tax=Mycolicibacterium sarraceniae TaxID=1534348 RepID=A0A7I7SSE0_9MYCO|nr:hypothetical protein MSAR_21010 [Mycolicibacterium sarraceniae]